MLRYDTNTYKIEDRWIYTIRCIRYIGMTPMRRKQIIRLKNIICIRK